jgi:hypothetical protein
MNTRCLLAAAALLIWTLPAAAQMPAINMMPEVKSRSPEERERDAQIEKAYKEKLRSIPDKAPTDPWGNVRGAEASAPAKPAAPKASAPKVSPKQAKNAAPN